MLRERRSARCGQSVRATAIIAVECLNESVSFETSKDFIESSWRQMDASELINVFDQCVAVLISSGKAGKYQDGSPRVPSKTGRRFLGFSHTGRLHRYPIDCKPM